MKQELKEKWIAALRSGDYKQGRGQLRKVDEEGNILHCCLGVLAEVAGLKISSSGMNVTNDDDVNGYAPLQKLIDEETTKVEYTVKDFYLLNDIDKLSFNEIAAFTERNL